MREPLSRIKGFTIYYSEKGLVESVERNGPSWQYSAFRKLRKVRIARVSFSMVRHPSMIFPHGSLSLFRQGMCGEIERDGERLGN